MLVGVTVALLRGSSPAQTILLAQAANALLLPIAGGFLLLACNARILGKYANGRFANLSAALALALVAGLSGWKIWTLLAA